MTNPAIQFEQVSVKEAKANEARAKRNTGRKRIKLSAHRASRCSICGEGVELERCKIDEQGRPVHEECYVKKVKERSNRAEVEICRVY